VFVAAGAEMYFYADYVSTDTGFDICGSPSSGPSDAASDFVGDNLYLICGGGAILLCFFLYCCQKMCSNEKREVLQVREGGRQGREGRRQGGGRQEVQRIERGEVVGVSEIALVQQQSVEGAVEMGRGDNVDVEIAPIIQVPSDSHISDVRPVFSLTFNEPSGAEHPMPSLDTERTIDVEHPMPSLDTEATLENNLPDYDRPSENKSSPLDIAPPALAPDDLAPQYEEAPPPYQPPPEEEPLDLEGAAGKKIRL